MVIKKSLTMLIEFMILFSITLAFVGYSLTIYPAEILLNKLQAKKASERKMEYARNSA
ncbi:hypothetical protein PY093_07045 [Cytobacillus sp. S13-E01]|uniref:hypothetical protein n=1 Tax=Cytobacillus sp. S13-E01 TaxID=3031326 RepID=UPI0023D8BC04|nr:hypothetical protein [Cytobacillus sp. S13-E01]MDF0726470.1 hypothetical protein [Cytobacillus sp. S13-E01]